MYDIIGDVHGHATLLKKLLLQLGYIKTETGYAHPNRKAIFVGDFINRGPEIRKSVRIIRTMVENDHAFAILGNHEINAIIYHLKFQKGDPLVKAPRKYFMPLFKTINEFIGHIEEWTDHLKWFRTLPLFIDLNEIRVVHACWSEPAIQILKTKLPEGKIKKSVFREIYRNSKSDLSQSFWTLTKGIDFKLPSDLKIINNKGVSPRSFRMRWWEQPHNKTFEEMSFESKSVLPSYTIPEQIIPQSFTYPENAPIVFFGHYCRFKGPHIIKPNICCVDSCVAGNKMLTAYCWNGEKVLDELNLVQVGK
jgi:hypothetical protein